MRRDLSRQVEEMIKDDEPVKEMIPSIKEYVKKHILARLGMDASDFSRTAEVEASLCAATMWSCARFDFWRN